MIKKTISFSVKFVKLNEHPPHSNNHGKWHYIVLHKFSYHKRWKHVVFVVLQDNKMVLWCAVYATSRDAVRPKLLLFSVMPLTYNKKVHI